MKKISHLGIILDGNRRWAKERGLPGIEGHRKGYDVVKAVGDWCLERGIMTLTVFGFSTENWKRTPDEVENLMSLILKALTMELPTFIEKGIRVKVIGSRQGLSDKLLKAIDNVEEKTKDNGEMTFNVAINYGGRLEIVEAVKKVVASGVPAGQVTEEFFAQNLWMSGQDDPDMIIRTSGEQRLSGFLTWESVYSELYFIDKHWPDFTAEDLDKAIEEFERRQRRFGK